MINSSVKKLVDYALSVSLIKKDDAVYCTNRLLELLGLDEYEQTDEVFDGINLEETLNEILDYAVEKGLVSNDTTSRDLFDTKLMAVFVSLPSTIISNFRNLYALSPKAATDYFYKLSRDSNYIRRDRVKRDLKWKTESEYGKLDITINLSKPEKSPEEIAKAKLAKQSGYPKCLLCAENEGYAGRINHPARQNHRVIPVTIAGEDWGFQYSPYVYYNEHCILFNKKHVPMQIDRSAFEKLFSFVEQFPHYFIGSNADLPIVGGSILSHEHFQGGRYDFAMAKAEKEKTYSIKGFEDVSVSRVNWPMSVIRLSGNETGRIVDLAELILDKWRAYSDPDAFVFAETDGEKHNTITPIARKNGEEYELDLVLRNNITTKEHPLGVFHPHAELHHIKKENIGLIEVMGLAVLPSRLKNEIALLEKAILNGNDISSVPEIEKHAEWVESFRKKYDFNEENIETIIENEIGNVFKKVLEHAGVFKRNETGKEQFDRFIASIAD